MYNGPICQEQLRNRSAVFPMYISYTNCIPTHCNHINLLDLHFDTHHPRISHNNDLPWLKDKFITVPAAISYPKATTSLQCYIMACPPTPHYEDHVVAMHVSLDKANLNIISTPDFYIWQHFDSNWATAHMQKLADIHEVSIPHLYKHMIGQSEPILLFEIERDMKGPSLTWKLLTHPGTYIGTISIIFIVCIGVYCLKRFWCRSATLRHWAYSPVSSWHVIVDDDVEVTPIYRSRGIVEKAVRSCEHHDLRMEQEAVRLESHCKQPVLSKAVPSAGSLVTSTKIQVMQ